MQDKQFKVDALDNKERQFIIDSIANEVPFKKIAAELLEQFSAKISDSAIKRWWNGKNSIEAIDTNDLNTLAKEKSIEPQMEQPSDNLERYIVSVKEKIPNLAGLSDNQADIRINEYMCNQIFQELAVCTLNTIRVCDSDMELEKISYLIKNLSVVSNIMQVMPSYSYKSIAGKMINNDVEILTEEEHQEKRALIQKWQNFKDKKRNEYE